MTTHLVLWKCHVTTTDTSPYKEVSRDTGAYKSSDFHFSNLCSTFVLKNQLASFSYHHCISFTYGLQHYCFLGQSKLYRLCGFWQMPRQISTILLAQNCSIYLDVNFKIFKEDDKKEFQQIVYANQKLHYLYP